MIALEHVDRLKAELRRELDTIESKIVESEAENFVKRSRVEDLASILHSLPDIDCKLPDEDESQGQQNSGQIELRNVRTTLVEILEDVGCNVLKPSHEENLTEVLNTFRSRLMMAINTLDLVAVALRKHTNDLKRKSEVAPRLNASGNDSRVPLGSSAIIRSQELERHRIAREIHDGPAQAIANVVLRMDILSKIYEKDPNRVPDELARMEEIAQGALDEIRGFIFDLRPMTLQDLGLIPTIKRVVASLGDLSGLNVRLIVEGEERSLGQLVTLTIFRIAQEAMNNLRKHSKCKAAWVHLKYVEDKVILIVEDDGIGFDLKEVAQNQKKYASFGLLGMQERADDINAELEITSSSGGGTKIALIVPTTGNPALYARWDDKTE